MVKACPSIYSMPCASVAKHYVVPQVPGNDMDRIGILPHLVSRTLSTLLLGLAQISESERSDYENNRTKCAPSNGVWESVDYTFEAYRVFCSSWQEDDGSDYVWDQTGCEVSGLKCLNSNTVKPRINAPLRRNTPHPPRMYHQLDL